MKVLVVCMSGLTTTILANKLQKYADKQGYQDTFIPSRVGANTDLVSQSEVVIVAPQAKHFYEEFKKRNENQHAKILLMDEEMFVTAEVEEIYEFIKSAVGVVETEANTNERFNLALLLNILCEAVLQCLPVALLGFGAYVVSAFFNVENLDIIYHSTLAIVNFYLVFSIGYIYGKKMNVEPLLSGIIALSAPLITLPIFTIDYYNSLFRLPHGFISIEYFGIEYSLLCVGLAITAILILNALLKSFHIRYLSSDILHASNIKISLLLGFLFSVFLMFRIFFFH